MDNKRRKEKILKKINKDRGYGSYNSRPKSRDLKFETPKKVDLSSTDDMPEIQRISERPQKKPMYSNEKALGNGKLLNTIQKEKKSYSNKKNQTSDNPVVQLWYDFLKFVRHWVNKIKSMDSVSRYKFFGAWAVVILCIVIVIAIMANSSNENKKVAKKDKTDKKQVEKTEEEATTQAVVDENPLTECTVDAVNTLVTDYLVAMRDVDMDKMKSLDVYQDKYASDTYFKNTASVIEDYTNVKVYVKNGPYENGYMAFVVTDIKFKDIAKTCQGMFEYVIRQQEDGNYLIDTTPDNDIEDDDAANAYMEITRSDDVLALIDSVNQQCQADIASDAELKAYVEGTLNTNAALSNNPEDDGSVDPDDQEGGAKTQNEGGAEAQNEGGEEAPAE